MSDTTSRRSLFDRLFTYLHGRSSAERLLLHICLLGLLVSGGWLVWQYNQDQLVTVPTGGGTLYEGIIGTPRFVNPVLALTRTDQDLTALLYRSLSVVAADGSLTPDLAESITRSDDGLVYNITLKQDQYWHDNTPITADDVVYTIGLIQDPELKSPLRGNWNDVTIEQIDTHELNIVLEEAYVPFAENLTVGILPKHLWSELSADEFPFSPYNTEPVGSGPYLISEVKRTDAGLINTYVLERFAQHTPAAQLASVEVSFWNTEADLLDALETGAVTHTTSLSNSVTKSIAEEYTVYSQPLPRVFALYTNPNRSAALRDQAAREALNVMIPKDELIDEVLAGYGTPANSPVPAGYLDITDVVASSTGLETAQAILESGGWSISTTTNQWTKEIDEETVTLQVTISTANSELFANTANFVADAWQELGVDVSVALFEQADLVQAVIRPRDYQLLLFGTEVGRAVDLYPFWHSSQREDPGLNIALYTNITTDEYLEDYRITTEPEAQQAILQNIVTELQTETPAFFLFTPHFTYITRGDADIPIVARMNRPSERFATITDWYLEAESVWPLFTD